MTVGATTQNDTLASFSNYGPCVDISAPGQNVTGAWPLVNDRHAAAVLSGTSMAAPFVAGVALQIMGLHPHFSADDVRRALICLSTRDALHVRDPFTHNRLLFSSRRVLDQPGLRLLVEAQHADPGDMRDATECFTPTEADSIVQLFGDDPAEAALTHGDDVGPHPTPSPDAAGSPSQTPSPTPAAWARGHARRRHRRGRSHTLLHDVPVL